jgi:predicted DsbA family dithiol-disulfide isomerase
MKKLSVQIWSDVVCPWCYVGKRRFEAALAAFAHRDDVVVSWHAFELDTSAPRSYEGKGSYAERLARKYGMSVAKAEAMIEQMTATAAKDGITFDFAHARTGNTFDAHRLIHFARVNGGPAREDAMKERLLRACFTEGEPIADVETLVRLASDVGLDPEAARAALMSDAYAADVREDEAKAHSMGVSGVPFFVVGGKYGVAGAQPKEMLLEVLERAWKEAHGGIETLTGDAPSCDGDHCA